MKSLVIWQISKYLAPPLRAKVGSRGFFLMREFAARDHQCLLITSNSNHLANAPKFEGAQCFESIEGVDILWLNTLQYSRSNSIRRFLSWIHFEWRLCTIRHEELPRPDVVIVSSLSLLSIVNGWLFKQRYRCKLVFEVRDIWPLTLTEVGGYSSWHPMIWLFGVIERFGYRHADLIVGTMPNLGAHVREVAGNMTDVACVPMGVSEEQLRQVDSPLVVPAHSEMPKNKFVVAYAGSLGIANAMGVFFEAAQLLHEHSHFHFLILGDGDLKAEYESQFGHLSNISFVDRVDKMEVQSVIGQADVLYFSVHPDRIWEYGQSLNKVIDYMLAAKPIVASYSGYPSMVNEAGCGSFVPAGDANALAQELIRLSELPESERKALGRRGREWILKNRTFRQLANDYLNLLESL